MHLLMLGLSLPNWINSNINPPWINSNICSCKNEYMNAEHRWKKSGLQVHYNITTCLRMQEHTIFQTLDLYLRLSIS